jgi:hypothetical protein
MIKFGYKQVSQKKKDTRPTYSEDVFRIQQYNFEQDATYIWLYTYTPRNTAPCSADVNAMLKTSIEVFNLDWGYIISNLKFPN